ncbi:hypothetical protein PR202_gb15036 [Eleusine coracana subsp. coracana]|uniref:Uncharacterized protein n=1 Tax=Eleusine coracana subsp. coracana TaxID=191504 RepID=A0AAV5EX75_ELECO|nr:hypothetical protein PR202_gb15036 [Eleusine coracana subsp. coracana]
MAGELGWLALVLAQGLLPYALAVYRGDFPPNFLFGTSTSAYQIEGAYLEGNRGLSNWDVFAHKKASSVMVPHTPPTTATGFEALIRNRLARFLKRDFSMSTYVTLSRDPDHRGNAGTCNGLGELLGVLALLVEAVLLLLKIFSVVVAVPTLLLLLGTISDEVSRVTALEAELIPNSMSSIKVCNPIMFTPTKCRKQNIDSFELFSYLSIEPFVTICHYDIPQELEKRYGGWLSPEIQKDFGYFADACFKMFGDRVKFWTTFNQPNLFIKFSYMDGWYPPGRCSQPFGNCAFGNSSIEPYIAGHNMILSHATAVSIYKTRSLDPIILGDYPSEMRKILGPNLPEFTSKQKKKLQATKLDFIGLNHYTTLYIKDCIFSPCEVDPLDGDARVLSSVVGDDGVLIGEPGRIEVMEIGGCNLVHADRIAILFVSSRRKGADVRGYFLWSLLDDFEWTSGYTLRFGLYHVDFETLKRTPKISAKWYRDFLKRSLPRAWLRDDDYSQLQKYST